MSDGHRTCASCSIGEFMAQRLDAVSASIEKLKAFGNTTPETGDVIAMARFIMGEEA